MPNKETVYDGKGNAHEVFSVDAREMIAGGDFFGEKPEPKAKASDEKPKAKAEK